MTESLIGRITKRAGNEDPQAIRLLFLNTEDIGWRCIKCVLSHLRFIPSMERKDGFHCMMVRGTEIQRDSVT